MTPPESSSLCYITPPSDKMCPHSWNYSGKVTTSPYQSGGRLVLVERLRGGGDGESCWRLLGCSLWSSVLCRGSLRCSVTLGDSFAFGSFSFSSLDCSTCCSYQTSVSSRSSSRDFIGSRDVAFSFSATLVAL